MKTERHYAQRHSKVSELLAQGEEQWIKSRMPKWGKPASQDCPACGSRECGIDKLKVKAVKWNNNMLNGSLKTPNGCSKWV